MWTERQFDECRKKLRALRANLDDCASSLRDEVYHGSGAVDAGGLFNVPIHLGDLRSQKPRIGDE